MLNNIGSRPRNIGYNCTKLSNQSIEKSGFSYICGSYKSDFHYFIESMINLEWIIFIPQIKSNNKIELFFYIDFISHLIINGKLNKNQKKYEDIVIVAWPNWLWCSQWCYL